MEPRAGTMHCCGLRSLLGCVLGAGRVFSGCGRVRGCSGDLRDSTGKNSNAHFPVSLHSLSSFFSCVFVFAAVGCIGQYRRQVKNRSYAPSGITGDWSADGTRTDAGWCPRGTEGPHGILKTSMATLAMNLGVMGSWKWVL